MTMKTALEIPHIGTVEDGAHHSLGKQPVKASPARKERKKKSGTSLTDIDAAVLRMAEQATKEMTISPRSAARHRAHDLRERMAKCSSIYNAAWMVRYYRYTSSLALNQAIIKFCCVLAQELEQTKDKEALIYAVADSLTLGPHGLPWES